MSFSPDFDVKDRVKQATDLVDLIGSDLNLVRRGAIYKGHCPFHDDKTPSFQVNPAKQTWACYPCVLNGDAFDFVMKREGVNFREALELLAERANIPMTSFQAKIVKGSVEDKTTLYQAMKWAEQEYHQFLLHSDAAIPIRQYLAERGISQESIETFKIGFAPLSWSWLVDRSRNTSYSPEILEACGLVAANQRGSWYERFRGRVLFPIFDTQERPIAFGGRVIPGLYGEGEEPKGKYINSPETRLFSKSKNLYALNLVREFVQRTDEKQLTIVEGYTDVIAAWQSGLRNVVAALGTALNEQHIRLIRRFANGITLVLDGDEAGQRRSNEVLDLFITHDIDLRILSLPEGVDPFDYLMENGSAPFQEMVSRSPDAITHKIRVETDGIDLVRDTHRANQALENILETLAKVPEDAISVSAQKGLRLGQMVLRIANQFQISKEQVQRRLDELRNSTKRRPVASTTADEPPAVDYSKFDRKESELLQLLIQAPSFLDKAVENISPGDFEPGPLRSLYELMGEHFHEGKDVGYASLMLELEGSELKPWTIRLHDEAIQKKQDAEENGNELKLESQLDSIISAFNQRIVDSGRVAKISQLHGRDLDEKEEKSTLEELFNQQIQKIKKTK